MRLSVAIIVLTLVPAPWAVALTTTTTSFQNGDANGYTGTFDMRISLAGGTADGTLGSTVAHYLIDGYQPDDPQTPGNEFSPDSNGLLRFDNIIGNAPGQIPTGALILDAQLQITTGNGGSDDSGGPWGVAGLLQSFDANTRYGDFPGGGPVGFRGAWWEDGYATRPSGGVARQVQDQVNDVQIRSLVQRWADGEPNNGLVLQAGWTGQTNGWGFYTTGVGNPALRPKLTVTYTDPNDISVKTFQRDLNGYAGDTMAWVKSGLIQNASTTNPDPSVDDSTYDGYTGIPSVSISSTIDPPPAPLTSFQEFLDGPAFGTEEGVLTSPDDFALIKFANVFGSGADQAPADKAVAKGWLVITTGNESGNARSNGEWAAYTMLADWDTTSLYSDFGAIPGLQASENEISGPLSTAHGMITGSEVWFDVTDYLETIRNSTDDFNVAVTQFGTSDGWEIHLNGSPEASARPRLVVVSDLSSVVGLAGDYNNDGNVDAADYVLWRKDPASFGGTPGGYNTWRANFGNSSASGSSLDGAAVPEPTAVALTLLAGIGISFCASRKR